MPRVEKLIMEDYRRRMMSATSTYGSTVRAIARKFDKTTAEVKEIITRLSPTRTKEAIYYNITAGNRKNMKKVTVSIHGQEAIWYTTADEEEIKEKIEKLRHRKMIEM